MPQHPFVYMLAVYVGLLIWGRHRVAAAVALPRSWGEWFLGSMWAAWVMIIFFASIGIQMEKWPNPAGWVIMVALTGGLWFLSGLPAVGWALGAIKSRRLHGDWARGQGLPYARHLVRRVLLPPRVAGYNPYLANLIQVSDRALVADALVMNAQSNPDGGGGGMRVTTLGVVEGVGPRGLTLISQSDRSPRAPDQDAADLAARAGLESLEVGGRNFVLAGRESLVSLGFAKYAQGPELARIRELAQDLLEELERAAPGLLEDLRMAAFYQGRVILDMKARITDQAALERLAAGVRCLSAWPGGARGPGRAQGA